MKQSYRSPYVHPIPDGAGAAGITKLEYAAILIAAYDQDKGLNSNEVIAESAVRLAKAVLDRCQLPI
jgi:hypothetical protein